VWPYFAVKVFVNVLPKRHVLVVSQFGVGFRIAVGVATNLGILIAFGYAYTNNSLPSEWPLQAGRQNRMVPAGTVYYNASGIADMKNALKTYGPVDVGVASGDYWYFGNSAPAWTITTLRKPPRTPAA
jgi:hypothetical protein